MTITPIAAIELDDILQAPRRSGPGLRCLPATAE
jgi:hypothetical protein